MHDTRLHFEFAVKWVAKFTDPNIQCAELENRYLADDYEELGLYTKAAIFYVVYFFMPL